MSSSKRPPLNPNDTLDATRLKGTLSKNGVAALRPDSSAASGHQFSSGIPASSQDKRRRASELDDAPNEDDASGAALSDDSIEDYDRLEVDPDTLVANTRKSLDDSYRPSNAAMPDDHDNNQDSSEAYSHKKRNSIQITLARTDKKGRYVLTADDPEIKDILQKGLEREEAENNGTKSNRLRFRDVLFTRQFTTFDRQNPASAQSPFFGFFTLFWICMSLIFCQVALRNWRDYGSILGGNQVMKLMMSRDVFLLGVTDGVMCAATFEAYLFQLLVQRGWVNWARSGWVIQNIWQTAYLGAVVGWTYFREWPWTHTIFVVLHGLVFVMKQHSYAFYNGYLSSVLRRRRLLEQKLKQLETLDPVVSRPTSPLATHSEFISGVDLTDVTNRMQRRSSTLGPHTSTNLSSEKSDVADVAAAIQSGQPINTDQLTVMSNIIQHEIDELNKELRGKSDSNATAYPNNLTLFNYGEYICLPTLVYELAYPRQEKTNWWYVLEKTTATFGVLCVMQVISQGYIYPLVRKTVEMKDAGMTLDQRWQEFPFILSDMLFPMLIEQLLTWYLIWECILNVLAEVTCFADRGFYGDWWNSVTFDQYARDWNRPVHNFLLRHVYHSSISTFHLSKTAATFVTFLLSALVHEMCMAVIFKKVRGYLFWMQLLQMPLVMLSKSKVMKGRVILGNTIFWIGLFIGPAFLTSLYLVV